MLFDDDSDTETNFKTNNEYAKNYDKWRKSEELNKLKTKYGDDLNLEDESSSSSEDDEEGIELTEKVEKDFFKTLAYIKNKDPRIYDKNVQFFNDTLEVSGKKGEKKKKDKPMFLKDYERKILLEKGGIVSDDEDNNEGRPRSPTFVEEQKQIKNDLKKALDAVDEDDDENWGGIFKEREKTKEEKHAEEEDYKKWLAGQEKQLDDKHTEKELKPLKDYWNRPDLDDGEKFLRDYILNKKFLENDNDEYVPTYEEIIHDSDKDLSNDEAEIEKQEEFEHKFNFRFEEPDQEFIKRFPRTMEQSLRKTDDRRKVKRQEIKERKKKEKEEKMQDLKRLQELKRKEIEEKLEKLKEITGNPTIGFEDEDFDEEFDPEKHDRKMQSLFNNDFYQGAEDEQKPEFPDLDEELEIENWARYDNAAEEHESTEPHCEDEDFNMDCDYDPDTSTQKTLIENSKRKGKKKRKSKFAEAISQPKPKFDPNDKNYEKYFDDYYKLDCEDIIGDIPCRFKYREVVPNDFGLTVEEILLAKEKELNKWCSLKKAIQIRPENVERYEQIAYKKKGQNLQLKQRILPSIFTYDAEDGANKNIPAATNSINLSEATEESLDNDNINHENAEGPKTKSKKRKPKLNNLENNDTSSTVVQKERGGINVSSNEEVDNRNQKTEEDTNEFVTKKKRKKKNKKKAKVQNNNSEKIQMGDKSDKNSSDKKVDVKVNTKKRKRTEGEQQKHEKQIPKKRFKKETKEQKPLTSITDARLLAYGIKPKKFKNKLKYKAN